jgi:hypothetical protein
VRTEDLRAASQHAPALTASPHGTEAPGGSNRNIREALEKAERQQILAALAKANWVVAWG